MDEKKQAALGYLISRKLLTKEEYQSLDVGQIFATIKSKRKHQLKGLEVTAAKILSNQF